MPATRRSRSSATTTFTNNKVIVAKVFNNKRQPERLHAEAVQEHGTHVAGTVACNFDTPATVDGVADPVRRSPASRRAALLGNYNIFPGDVDGCPLRGHPQRARGRLPRTAWTSRT